MLGVCVAGRISGPHRVSLAGHACRDDGSVPSRDDELVVPPVFPAEVGGALARVGFSHAIVRRFLVALLAAPHEIATVGPRKARRAMEVALATGLRRGDATYVWLAAHEKITLCTLDAEMVERGRAYGGKVIGP